MDNERIDAILENLGDRKFWLKPWGLRDLPGNPNAELAGQHELNVGFPDPRPIVIQVGDIIFGHRITASKLNFLAETTGPSYGTPEEYFQQDPYEKPWLIPTLILTTDYSSCWNDYELKPLDLAAEFNEANPDDPINVNRIYFGAVVHLTNDFAVYLLEKILAL